MTESPLPNFEKFAQMAYHAYGNSTNFQNFMGDPMPNWQALPEKIKHAWVAAAKQVIDDIKKDEN